MVQDTRKTLRPNALKPVNMPEAVEVEEGTTGLPVALKGKRRQLIAAVEDTWRLDDEWWRNEPVTRLYFAIRLASGQLLVIFKDLVSSRWYRQSY